MPKISKHGKQRMKKRIGVSLGTAKIYSRKALVNGLKHGDTTGDLNGWLAGKIMAHNKSSINTRIYRGYLYAFSMDHTLVTVYPIPEEYENNLEQYVKPDAFRNYMKHIEEGIEVNRARERKRNSKKYREKRKEFMELVLINDLAGFAEGRYDVNIVGLTTNGPKLTVRYVPLKSEVPQMQELVSYIRDTTSYKVVRLVHARGIDGKPIYNRKYVGDPYEDELVYSC